MKPKDYASLINELKTSYVEFAPQSAVLNERARRVLVDGGSHTLRLMQPFPPRIVQARGGWIKDEDGHTILDFWQGHIANILGHNPSVVTSTLAQTLDEGFGLETGFTDRLQVEFAELLCQCTGAERVRFTTSGTLATMYSILLARALTDRDLVMKVGGGWHGAQPWALKGVGFQGDRAHGFQHVETSGLSVAQTNEVIVTRYNDADMLHDHFQQHGDQLACFIVEPFIGSGGFIPATREYLQTARALTQRYGTVLIFDEVIAGFRFRAGNMGALYEIQPDLATFGKVIGGGMPVAAVAGQADIMNLAGRSGGSRVKFSGGTYSAHPASLLTGKTMVQHLVDHKAEIYPRIAALGKQTRSIFESTFAEEGIDVRCTGSISEVLPGQGSSAFMPHFPRQPEHRLIMPEDVFDPAICHVALSQEALQLALLLENVHVMHGHGAVSLAHTEADLVFLEDACRRVARRFKPYL